MKLTFKGHPHIPQEGLGESGSKVSGNFFEVAHFSLFFHVNATRLFLLYLPRFNYSLLNSTFNSPFFFLETRIIHVLSFISNGLFQWYDYFHSKKQQDRIVRPISRCTSFLVTSACSIFCNFQYNLRKIIEAMQRKTVFTILF